MPRHAYRWLLPLIPIAAIVLWTLLSYQYPPTEIAEYLGARNGYFATLILSFIGGLSILVPVPYHLVVMTFAAGGLNPFLLGAIASVGQFCGDSVSYFLGYSGRSLAPRNVFAWVQGFINWSTDRAYWQVATALFLYGAFSPLSNDWLLIPMGLAGYPYRKVMLPLELGNIVFNTGIALLGTYGFASLFGV